LSIFRLLLATILLIPFNVNAGQGAPAGYAKRAFDTWLAAHNSGDPTKLEAFNSKYDPENDYK
jgi:hypothetical protein